MQQIFSHTPLYVWAILGFLVYRGVLASKTRQMPIQRICIIPIVMLLLSLQGIHNSFGLDGAAPLLWAVGMLLGGSLSWKLSNTAGLAVDAASGVIEQRGSWIPLVLMVALFCTKYAVAVTQAMHPALQHSLPFMASVATVYGIFSGIFTGGLLRKLAAYRQAQSKQLHPA